MIKNLKNLLLITDTDVKHSLIFAILTGLLLFIAEYAFIIVLQSMLSSIGIADAKSLDLPKWLPTGAKYSLLFFFLVGAIRVSALMLKNYLIGVTNQKFLRSQREMISNYAIYNAEKTSTHEMTSLYTDILSRSGSTILDLTGLVITITSISLLFLTGLTTAPVEMCIGTLGLFLTWVPIRFINKKISTLGDNLSIDWGNITRSLLENIRHNYFFRAHGLEQEQLRTGQIHLKSYETNYGTFYRYSAIKNGFPNIAGILLVSSIAYISITFLNTKGSALLSFLYIFIRVAQGGGELSVTLSHLRLNLPSAEKLVMWNSLFNSSSNNHSSFLDETKQKLRIKSLTTKDLSFSYEDKKIIDKLNLSLNSGDILIISGQSGSGKSTLLSLLLSINQPSDGSICINDLPLSISADSYKRSIAYVGPEPFLFNASIKDNILLGSVKESLSSNEIEKAISLSCSDLLISEKPEGINYILDEHADISTGQKQRISICRAILRDPDLFILDEATANLDSTTEQRIMNNLKDNFPNSIFIIVTHKKELFHFGNKHLSLDRTD